MPSGIYNTDSVQQDTTIATRNGNLTVGTISAENGTPIVTRCRVQEAAPLLYLAAPAARVLRNLHDRNCSN